MTVKDIYISTIFYCDCNIFFFFIRPKNNITNSDNNIFTEIDFNRTLDEISQDIVQLCLSQNKNNQSLTAKQLGISRSTLWRYLNRS